MERLVTLCTAVVFIAVCFVSVSAEMRATVIVDDDRLGIGIITGGHFGPGSFSIGSAGRGRPEHLPVYNDEDDGDNEDVNLGNHSHNGGQQNKNRPSQRGSASDPHKSEGKTGNEQINPAKTLRTHTNSGQGGQEGRTGSGGGRIFIGKIDLPRDKNNKGNKRKNGSNGVNNDFPSAEHTVSNNGGRGDIFIPVITGGDFEDGAFSINNNDKRPPGANVLMKKSTINKGQSGYPNVVNQEVYTSGHGGKSNGDDVNVETGYNSGYKPGSNDDPWIWSD